ncbi:MAG: type II toxin-antitoxin system RelE/ParE family toxin [Burkholderiaceae bacterium]|nr:type II toxin-antitoxin system RelE/ParE family toxin [Burkholderiaceae bacterium]
MNHYSVVFAPEASEQLDKLFRYIADQGSPLIAERFIDAIIATCETLASFPYRGVSREDVRPGLRITHHKGRTIIAYAVNETKRMVLILGIFYGGQAYEAFFETETDD